MKTKRNPFKYLQTLSLLLVTALLLSSCSQTEQPLTPTKAQIIVFGTYVDMTLYTDEPQSAEDAIQRVEQRFQQFHQEWHAWEKGGIVSKINQAIAAGQSIEVSSAIKDFILKSQNLSANSDFLFDPAIGKLVALWGFHSEQWTGPPPSDADIQTWLDTRPSIADLHFDGLNLSSTNPNVQLDFGGNAKGLALDIAMQQIRQAGIENAMVNIGGDMRVIGSKNGQAWRIGIQNPAKPSKAIAMLELSGNESVVTSGTYQRFFEWQGQRFSHILDPNTGRPANSFASVTVIHPDATTADTAATAILIAGPLRWRAIAESLGIDTVFIIDHDGQILQTKSITQRIKILDAR